MTSPVNFVARGAFFALALTACGGDTRFVAGETPNMDADIRVFLAIPSSSGEKKIEAHTRNERFEYPLKTIFEESDNKLRVLVFAFSQRDLVAAYPALSGRSIDDIKNLLRPAFGTVGPGAYQIPTPLRVLSTEISPDSAGEVQYETIDFESLAGDDNVAFTFALPGEVACEPGESAVRVFKRSEPGVVCTFNRSAGCRWEPSTADYCTNLDDIFERAMRNVAIRETPPHNLNADPGDLRCNETAGRMFGETRTWMCGGSLVSMQHTPAGIDNKDANVIRWTPKLRPEGVQGLVRGGVFTLAEKGAIYAVLDNSFVTIKRIQALAQDGVQAVDLVEGFEGFTSRISIAGSVMGRPLRLTTNQNYSQIIAHGERASYVLISEPDIGLGPDLVLSFYEAEQQIERGGKANSPTPIIDRATLTGHIVSGTGANIFAVTQTGIAVMRNNNGTVERMQEPPSGLTFTTAMNPQIVTVLSDGDERVVVWLNTPMPSTADNVFVFDSAGAVVVQGCHIEGPILTAIDGPRLVRRRPGDNFVVELVDLKLVEAGTQCNANIFTPYFIPPNNNGAIGPIEMDLASYLVIKGADNNTRELLRYRYEQYVGVLDLTTGFSQAIPLSTDAPASIMFQEDNGRVWGIAAAGTEDFPQILFPLLKVTQ